jgi:outer membrane lipoprotein-sorting protein
MKVRPVLFLLPLLAAVLPIASRADARADQWIASARATLGTEQALNGVNAVHFIGVLDTTEKEPVPDKPGVTVDKPIHLAIDIIFAKPYRQRIMLRSDKNIDTTGLDDYDGWTRRVDVTDSTKWQMRLLDITQIKHLRANTWENLAFYRGIKLRGGRVEYLGEETIDGKACVKLSFIHAEDIVFTRYLDRATGRLIKTVTEAGGEIREEGEILVSGVRFPQRLITKDPSGQVVTVTFTQIKVNEAIPDSEFAVPSLGR